MKSIMIRSRILFVVLYLTGVTLNSYSQSLKIVAGTYLKNNGSVVTLFNTDLQNNGTITVSNGSFVFSGSSNNSISGTGTTNMNMILLSKQSGSKLLLQKNITATGSVSFNGGILDLTDKSLELIYPGGILQNESAVSRITASGSGQVFISQLLNNPAGVNPGNLGAVITSSQNPGQTIIKRGHAVQVNSLNEQSITRYFDISPSNNSGLNANLRINYFDTELNNNTESVISMWQKFNAWSSIGITASDTTNNYVQKNGLNSFGLFTLGKGVAGGPLPLQLISFTVTCNGGTATLQWVTEMEVNTKHFIIEKSDDGVNWQPAATKAAEGNGNQHLYSAAVPNAGYSYFRLKMEDIDGKFTYSPVRKASCNTGHLFTIGPNPTKGKLQISVTSNTADHAIINVADMNGRIILAREWQIQKGRNSQAIDLSKISPATYMVTIRGTVINGAGAIIKY
ncbi:MAG TPA: T9SS type A sorting domain-containing protein [Chitinophagaceae bacterium]